MSRSAERWPTTAGVGADLARWHQILADGFHNDADVRWLTSPDGLLAVCRQADRDRLAGLLDDADLDALLADLDDRLPAFPGPLPSDRARALLTLATLPPGVPVPAGTSWAFAPAGAEVGDVGDPGDCGLSPDRLDQLRAHLDGVPNPLATSVSVPVVVSHHSHGDVVLMTLRRSPWPGIGPDLVAAPFQRTDLALVRAVADGAAGLRFEGGIRFAALSRRTHQPLDALGGPSAGLGAALAARRLLDPRAAPLDPEWVFTGRVDRLRRVLSLVGPSGSNEYGAKVSALPRGGTLVYPARDRMEVERAVAAHGLTGLRLEGVATVGETERLAERHLDGRRAYQRAVQPGPVRGRLVTMVAALSLLVLAGVLAATGSAWLRAHHRAAGLRNEAAAGPTAIVSVPPSPDELAHRFEVDATEVSNRRYAACVEAAVCARPTGEQAMPIDGPGHAEYPVTGLSAAEAEQFCGYARGTGWGLPTYDQYVEMTVDETTEFPHGDLTADPAGAVGELPVKVEGVVDPDARSLSHVTGNVAEWTQTKCLATGGCLELQSVRNQTGYLRTFGLSYLVLARADHIDPGWVGTKNTPKFLAAANAHQPALGFRCATPSAATNPQRPTAGPS